jgi:hypothetical protein
MRARNSRFASTSVCTGREEEEAVNSFARSEGNETGANSFPFPDVAGSPKERRIPPVLKLVQSDWK